MDQETILEFNDDIQLSFNVDDKTVVVKNNETELFEKDLLSGEYVNFAVPGIHEHWFVDNYDEKLFEVERTRHRLFVHVKTDELEVSFDDDNEEDLEDQVDDAIQQHDFGKESDNFTLNINYDNDYVSVENKEGKSVFLSVLNKVNNSQKEMLVPGEFLSLFESLTDKNESKPVGNDMYSIVVDAVDDTDHKVEDKEQEPDSYVISAEERDKQERFNIKLATETRISLYRRKLKELNIDLLKRNLKNSVINNEEFIVARRNVLSEALNLVCDKEVDGDNWIPIEKFIITNKSYYDTVTVKNESYRKAFSHNYEIDKFSFDGLTEGNEFVKIVRRFSEVITDLLENTNYRYSYVSDIIKEYRKICDNLITAIDLPTCNKSPFELKKHLNLKQFTELADSLLELRRDFSHHFVGYRNKKSFQELISEVKQLYHRYDLEWKPYKFPTEDELSLNYPTDVLSFKMTKWL